MFAKRTVRGIGDCTIEIEHQGLPTDDRITWLEVDAAVERILGFCTVPWKDMSGGSDVIGENENFLVTVSGPHPDSDEDDVQTLQVGDAVLMGDVENIGNGALDPSRKRKCRDEGVSDNFEMVARKSLCTDTCDNGRLLKRSDLMFGLRKLSQWTLFFCGKVVAGIVEVGGGS
ncbi:MAG: hypothetical protein M1836_002594 [Candelina mexicana]|nr:MAG: hypothetical protein M1836_002594 [Candelina mexicana]